MSSDLQRSNVRVMTQKVEKAIRLLSEVKTSIEIRGKPHPLWDDTKTHTDYALINLGHIQGCLEAVAKFNKEAEAKKI